VPGNQSLIPPESFRSLRDKAVTEQMIAKAIQSGQLPSKPWYGNPDVKPQEILSDMVHDLVAGDSDLQSPGSPADYFQQRKLWSGSLGEPVWSGADRGARVLAAASDVGPLEPADLARRVSEAADSEGLGKLTELANAYSGARFNTGATGSPLEGPILPGARGAPGKMEKPSPPRTPSPTDPSSPGAPFPIDPTRPMPPKKGLEPGDKDFVGPVESDAKPSSDDVKLPDPLAVFGPSVRADAPVRRFPAPARGPTTSLRDVLPKPLPVSGPTEGQKRAEEMGAAKGAALDKRIEGAASAPSYLPARYKALWATMEPWERERVERDWKPKNVALDARLRGETAPAAEPEPEAPETKSEPETPAADAAPADGSIPPVAGSLTRDRIIEEGRKAGLTQDQIDKALESFDQIEKLLKAAQE
jgi:hypothetical protein